MIATLMNELGSVLPVLTAVVGIATIYLRSFVKNELNDLKEQFHAHLDLRYLSRDVMDVRLANIERRLDHIEEKGSNGLKK